jgi:hypothetical protein
MTTFKLGDPRCQISPLDSDCSSCLSGDTGKSMGESSMKLVMLQIVIISWSIIGFIGLTSGAGLLLHANYDIIRGIISQIEAKF